MKMKPVDPAAVIRDPHTKRPLSVEGDDIGGPDPGSYWTRRWLAGEIWKLEGDAWVRRLPDGTVMRQLVTAAPAEPTGSEPVKPLTTREVQ